MIQAKVTSKGQITIPKKIRDLLKLKTGDNVAFILKRDGSVLFTTKTVSVDEFFGKFHYKRQKKTTVSDMDKAIVRIIRRKYK